MEKNNTSGFLIAVDGPNGVGKSTLIQAIKTTMEIRGFSIYITREPTNTEFGDFVRQYAESHSGISLACLVAADRYEHIRNEIIPELNKGKAVITDRYVLSSLILQGMDDVRDSFILNLNSEIIKPDLQVAVFANEDILKKVKIVDLSADFRIKDVKVYEKWYGIEHKAPQFIEEAVYGLCEVNREAVKQHCLISLLPLINRQAEV